MCLILFCFIILSCHSNTNRFEFTCDRLEGVDERIKTKEKLRNTGYASSFEELIKGADSTPYFMPLRFMYNDDSTRVTASVYGTYDNRHELKARCELKGDSVIFNLIRDKEKKSVDYIALFTVLNFTLLTDDLNPKPGNVFLHIEPLHKD